MTASAASGDTTAKAAAGVPDGEAISVEPLSPPIGLRISGIDLHHLDAGAVAMIQDLWQLGGALLFRGQTLPESAMIGLAAALASGPFAPDDGLPDARDLLNTEWQMPGAVQEIPPKALVFAATGAPGLPPLQMAGMEAAADALRMEDTGLLGALAGRRAAHAAGGAGHPLIVLHAQSGEACLYPPPDGMGGFAEAARLAEHAGQQRFCWQHDWQQGDVLALDPRAVRCRWLSAPASEPGASVVVPGTVALAPQHAGIFGLD